MLATTARNVKRLVILVPGLVIGYLAYVGILPTFNRWLPWWLAFLITYGIVAYLLIPVAIRLFRIFIRPKHLPYYSTTPDGLASDPINIGVVCTKEQLIEAMLKAGWYQADERNVGTLLRLIVCFVLGQDYHKAPFSNLYLFGRKQDIGFELPVDDNPRTRHHVRFWVARPAGNRHYKEHLNFWAKLHQPPFASEHSLWVGAASRDVGLGIIRHNAQLTHMIDPDTNTERDLIVKHLKKTGLVKSIKTKKLVDPYSLTNRVLNGYLRSDGRLKICEL